ncbi:MAG: glycosyltransferase family 39 protein [Planctomycetes bacterium]|nr:glycosyltransferase family 39 protein [Planctomycetota bacterium]
MASALEAAPLPTAVASPIPELSRREYLRKLHRMTAWLIGLGLLARAFRYLLDGSIWNDEAAVALNIIRRDFEGLTHALDELQVAPILFLWAERAVLLVFGSSEWAMRLVPFLFGLAGLIVFWDFARRVVQPTAASLAIGIMAVARWPVLMSGTLKPYTADLFCATLLMALAVRWRQRPERLWPLVALMCVVPFTLGMSYPTVFVAGAVSVYLLPAIWQQRDKRSAVLFVMYNAMMLVSFGAVFALVLRQAADPQTAELKAFMRSYWAHGFPPSHPFEFVWWFIKIHTGRLMSFPYGDGHGGSTVTFLWFLTGVYACWKSGNRSLLVLCLTPFALNFVAAVAGQYPYGACTRLSMHLSPAICLLIGIGLAHLLEMVGDLRKRFVWVKGTFILLAAFGVGEMAVDAYKPHREPYGRWIQRIARQLDRQLQPGDEIAYRSPIPGQRETFDWYMTRFGERVSFHGPPVTHAETRRVWLIVITNKEPGVKEEAELLAALGSGWVSIARTEYVIQPHSLVHSSIYCTIHCVARDPGDVKTHPVLQSGP